ncbi:MAG: OmpA family protein [Pseudomonadota bacterium]
MAALALVLGLAAPAPAVAQDVAGSADHPLIGRFEGAVITGYDARAFDEYRFPQGPASGDLADTFATVEGVTTRIAYTVAGDASIAEVARAYAIRLEEAGFETVFVCADDACGGARFANEVERFPLPRMIVDPFNFRYRGARRRVEGGETHAAVLFSVDSARRVRVQVTVVETEAMTLRMVDAAAMASEIAETGRVALYGIQFDTDESRIRPESEPTLAEMAAFLKGNPGLEVVIVGHTDNQGSMAYNLGLSARRAEAVRDALATRFGIAAGRMAHAGAGFLAPVAPNTTPEGRALNRRVEIIAR